MRKWSKIPEEYHPSIPKPKNPIIFREKIMAETLEKSRATLTRSNKHTEPHIVQQHKTTTKKPFGMLNHHYTCRMEIALIKTKLGTKPSSNNQQQPTAIKIQINQNRRKNQKKK